MQTETITRAGSIELGSPAYHPAYSKAGHVARIDRAAGASFTIGGNGLQRDNAELTIVWEDLGKVTVSDNVARSWLDSAATYRIPPITADEAAARLKAAEDKARDDRDKAAREREEAKRAADAWQAEAARKVPAWAQAVIVAEFMHDKSDSMTDYFHSTAGRRLILGFSKHTRDLFPELRAAARNHPDTAALADAPASAEHREKWSMGAGYYLKAGHRYSDGWQIRKVKFWGDRREVPQGEWALTPPKAEKPAPATAEPVTAGGMRIEEHTHTKHGFSMWICIMADRVERAEFDRLREAAEALGGWYSRPWGKTPGGFAFKNRAAAETFANPQPSGGPDDDKPSGQPAPDVPSANPAPKAAPAVAERLRGLADAMQSEIDGKFRDRLTNTPKRQREADSARLDGFRLQRTQAALRALAAAHDAGNVPAELQHVKTKAAAFDLMRSEIDRTNCGYYDAGRDTGQPALDTPAALALWALVADAGKPDEKAEDLRRKVQALQFANIPGYFPTPRAVVDRMLDLAELPAGAFDFLEPEGGSGAILDAVRAAAPSATVTTYERHNSLREVLRLKGYEIAGSDFMEAEQTPRFDRVMMNPPFENGQDIDHVRHAFAMLRDGGRLVAVMSPGPFFRQDRKAVEFRAWFEARGGEKFDLPAGSFKESGTGTAAVLVLLIGDELGGKKAAPAATSEAPAIRVGTAHFASTADADRYYRPYGYTAAEKIAAGEIFIGQPMTCEPDECVKLDRTEGRYYIEKRRN